MLSGAQQDESKWSKPTMTAMCDLVDMAPTTTLCSKALKYFVLSIHPLNGTHTQSMSQLSQGLKILH